MLSAPTVLGRVRECIRYLHYSYRTEKAYVFWIRKFLKFHGMRHPSALGPSEVEAYLTWLADGQHVSASTHRQALAAILFLYKRVLQSDLPWLDSIGRPRQRHRLPVVLSRDEVARVLELLSGEHGLFARLLYGTGMRISEAQQLRVKDVDFGHRAIVVRAGKGDKDRVLMLPESLVAPLRNQLAVARTIWIDDRRGEVPGVWLPDALERKYPRAGASWPWFWVFPQAGVSRDPRSGVVRRTHVLKVGGAGVHSPLDMLGAHPGVNARFIAS